MSNDSTVLIVIIAVVVLGAGIGAFFIIRRHLWKKAVAEMGWTHDPNPGLDRVAGLALPPFDWGLDRKIDQSITGQTSYGQPFQVFEYAYAGGGGALSDRIAMVSLAYPLPELYVSTRSTGSARVGAQVGQVAVEPGFDATLVTGADDPAYATTLLAGPVRQLLLDWASTARVDVSVDGASLTAMDAPKDPEELKVFLDRLGAVAQAVDLGALERFRVDPKTPRIGFYRQDWSLAPTDDRWIDRMDGVPPFGQGHGRTTEDVVFGTVRGAGMAAFLYRWKTTHTRTVSDGKGGSRTETYTQNHSQPILLLELAVTTPDLAIQSDSFFRGLFGGTIDFESEEFNNVFDVTSNVPKFAHDVVHPRMIEFLLATRPPRMLLRNGMLVTYPSSHDVAEIVDLSSFAADFLSRIPGWVWKDLGAVPPVAPLVASPVASSAEHELR